MTDNSPTETERNPLARYIDEHPGQNRFWDKKYILFIEGITVIFDGFKALDIEAFGIEHNELRVIIGPNGAGKTPFCDVVSGKTIPATGEVFFDGQKISDKSEMDIALRGIRRKFQTPTVFDSLTTLENMQLALPKNQGMWANLLGTLKPQDRDQIRSIFERVGLGAELETPASQLSHGQRQWLSISTLILSDPKLLLIDEPAAGLSDSETMLTAELLLELKEDHTIVVIEHDMDFVRNLDSYISVFNEGLVMAEGTLDEIQSNVEVIDAYLGR
ncbi:MAG TPA: urea ABC transporter ATP-binding protein UrtD [Candidatus Hydrogenedentes bacterium]|nr:urea ABC transporter ATP-binding protein UrtD [Candidatus Hydrogenedentota bacterium]